MKNFEKKCAVTLLIWVFLIGCQPAFNLSDGNVSEASFQGLQESISGENSGFSSVAGGVSEDGAFVVGGSGSEGDEAFRWTTAENALENDIEAITFLGDFEGGSIRSWAEGVSANGSVIVGASEYENELTQAFRWTEDEGMVELGFLTGGESSGAAAVSQDGSIIIGQSQYEGGTQAYRWTRETGMLGLGFLPGGGEFGEAFAMTPDGSIIVGTSDSGNGIEAFRWDEENGIKSLGVLPDTPIVDGFACAASTAGDVIAGGIVTQSSAPLYEAFVWTEDAGIVLLGDLPGGDFSSIAYSISSDGSVIVGESATDSGAQAFIWDENNGMRNLREVLTEEYGLNLDGWIISRAIAISKDDTTIVGTGINPEGEVEGWRVNIP